MKKIIILLVLLIVAAYAYYDEGIQKHQNGEFRLSYANINFQNNDVLKVTRKILDSDADVIYVSEWTGKNMDPILILSSGYKVVEDAPERGTHGQLLLAKNKLNITASIMRNTIPGPCGMPVLTASLLYKKQLISLLGVHAPPPTKTCKGKTDETLKFYAGLVSNGKLSRNYGVGKRGDSIILVGDLNTLPFKDTIRAISQSGLVDAHKREGHFVGATWAPYSILPKLARIDFVFSSPELNIKHLWNTRLPGSDHNLLVADYALIKK